MNTSAYYTYLLLFLKSLVYSTIMVIYLLGRPAIYANEKSSQHNPSHWLLSLKVSAEDLVGLLLETGYFSSPVSFSTVSLLHYWFTNHWAYRSFQSASKTNFAMTQSLNQRASTGASTLLPLLNVHQFLSHPVPMPLSTANVHLLVMSSRGPLTIWLPVFYFTYLEATILVTWSL